MNSTLASFTDVFADEIGNSQPLSLSPFTDNIPSSSLNITNAAVQEYTERPPRGKGQRDHLRSKEEIDAKYRDVFSYPYFNLVQSSVIEDTLYSDKSIVVCAPTGSGKTVVFEMAIVQLLMELEDKQYTEDFKIIYMAPVKALCTERLSEWHSKFTRLGLLCIEVTGDTDVDFTQLKPYKIIITTPEKWDMLTRRWRDHRGLVEVIKLFLIDEVHILNDEARGPVLEAVVSRMKTIESSAQSVHRIEKLQKELQGETVSNKSAPRIRFVAVSATVSNPEDVANWLATSDKPAVFHKFGDECRPVKLRRIVEGYPCSPGTSIFKFDIILNYKLWPIIQKYHSGKPTLIFCNTRKSVILTAETLSRELTISFNAEQKARLTAVASSIKNKKLQALIMSGVGCHHAGLLYEERQNIEFAFRNRDLPILITTTTLAMGVNLPAHLVIVKNTQQYVNGAYQEYSISTVLQMVGRAGRPQFDTEATAVIMTRLVDKPRYQALVGGCEPLQSYLHKRLPENLNSEAALRTVGDVAQCVQWLRSTFLYVRALRDPKKYLGLPQNSSQHLISKKIEDLCVIAMNGLASSGLITMDEASCIESTEAGRLMSIFYLDLETMKLIMKIEGTESLERLLGLICESHELADMHLRVDERRCLNTLNRNNTAATIRFPMKGKISTRQMKLNCIIQAVLGCLSIPDPSLNQEAMKIMRIADRVCKCLVTYVTRPDLISQQPQFYSGVLNSVLLGKCVAAHLWENSPFVSKQLRGIGPAFSALLASAGKVNFMLLEESHPRDLERIMNKGAPAGNVLRKQVSLLPKYQLTMIPVDENTVTIQLVLLNKSHLSENMGNLTAGENHKSYIIVGDSNNHLLLLTAFKDKDLISVYDGMITHEVRRKHIFEHKIFAHCISSTFVGIDVQTEYSFNDLEQFLGRSCTKTLTNTALTKKVTERQTCITGTFKERKRKNNDTIEKSKEKRKRENALMENFKYLKKPFETPSKNINENLHQHGKQNDKCELWSLPNNTTMNLPRAANQNLVNNTIDTIGTQNLCDEDMESEEFIDDAKIDSILNEIENEMCKNKTNSLNVKTSNNDLYFRERCLHTQNPDLTKSTANILSDMSNKSLSTKCNLKTTSSSKRCKATTAKSNYNFIDELEKKISLSDDENKTEVQTKDNGFSDAIKSQIQKYLSKTRPTTNEPDRNIKMLLSDPDDELPEVKIKPTSLDSETFNINNKLCPKYEIKEILGDKDMMKSNSNTQQQKNNEDLVCVHNSKASDIQQLTNMLNVQSSNFNVVNTSQYDTNPIALIPGDSTHTINGGNLENNVKEIKPLSLNRCKGIFTNKKNIKTEVDVFNNNESDDIISVEEYIPKKYKTEMGYGDVGNINSDVIVVSPAPSPSEISNTSCSDQNSNLYVKTLAERNMAQVNYENLSPIVPNEKYFPNTGESSKIDAAFKNLGLDIVPINRHALDENERASHDGTIALKDACMHHTNQMQSNKSVLYAYASTDINPSFNLMRNDDNNQNRAIDSPNNIEMNKRKTEYVKKLTYSTSNIDICTKHTPEYSVHVIKKIKMDLDITAIVSRKDNNFQNYNRDCDKNSDGNKGSKIIELLHHKSSNQNPDNNAITTTLNKDSSYETKNTFECQTPSITLRRSESSTAKLSHKCNEIQENEMKIPHLRNTGEKPKTCNSIAKKNQSLNDTNETKIPEIVHDMSKIQGNENINCEEASGNISESKLRNIEVSGDNKIKNILQKYSGILAKNTITTKPSCSNINSTVTCYASPKMKPIRPFKITDIHKLHATLPDTIVENKPEATKDILTLPKENRYENVENPNKLENVTLSQYTELTLTEELPEYESITDLDFEPIQLPANVDYKIDQSMFDPKTLLQCVAEDDNSDEIVPPPPGFCDDLEYSPGYDCTDISLADDTARTPQNTMLTETDMVYSNNIFDDSCAANITPSTEIETWVLSQEDNWEPNNTNSIPKSFTVMRRNTDDDCNIFQNSLMSRQVKLGKFKFNQKNKLKIRK